MFSPGDAMIGLTIAAVVLLTLFLLGFFVVAIAGEWRGQRLSRRAQAQRRQTARRKREVAASRLRTPATPPSTRPAAAPVVTGPSAAVPGTRSAWRRRGGRPERALPVRANAPHAT